MAEMSFEGRVAIVTGAGRGLGREFARLLAARGARVVVNDLGTSERLTGSDAGPAHEVAREIMGQGGIAVADTNSVATPEGGKAIVQSALDAFGRVDIIIHNAGGTGDLQTTISVLLLGAYNVIGPAWPLMRGQGYGRVLTITSGDGLYGHRGRSGEFDRNGYGAAKMGLIGLTRNLANEGAAANVKVNALAPVAYSRLTAGGEAKFVEWLRTLATPDQVAPVAAWLVHEDCPVSGEIITAGGGRVARVFIAETLGHVQPGLTIEDVRDNWDAICDETNYKVFRDTVEESRQFYFTTREAAAKSGERQD